MSVKHYVPVCMDLGRLFLFTPANPSFLSPSRNDYSVVLHKLMIRLCQNGWCGNDDFATFCVSSNPHYSRYFLVSVIVGDGCFLYGSNAICYLVVVFSQVLDMYR